MGVGNTRTPAPGAACAFGQRPQSGSTVSFVVAIDRGPPTQDITIRIAVGDRADVMHSAVLDGRESVR